MYITLDVYNATTVGCADLEVTLHWPIFDSLLVVCSNVCDLRDSCTHKTTE